MPGLCSSITFYWFPPESLFPWLLFQYLVLIFWCPSCSFTFVTLYVLCWLLYVICWSSRFSMSGLYPWFTFFNIYKNLGSLPFSFKLCSNNRKSLTLDNRKYSEIWKHHEYSYYIWNAFIYNLNWRVIIRFNDKPCMINLIYTKLNNESHYK